MTTKSIWLGPAVLPFLVVLLLSWTQVEATNYHYRPKRRQDLPPEERMEEIVTWVRNMFVLATAPLVIKCLYAFVTDPDLPQVVMQLRALVYRKFTGYLGQDRNRFPSNRAYTTN